MRKLNHIFCPTAFKVGLIATFLCLLFYIMDTTFFHMMELKAFDLHFLSRGKIKPGSEVVIVAIDEKSIRSLGRWPWPRTLIASLVEKLNVYGAKVVAFDVIFSEPDESSGLSAIRDLKKRLAEKGSSAAAELEKAEKRADNDSMFSSVLKKSPSVILGYFFFTEGGEAGRPDVVGGRNEGYVLPSRYSSIRYLDNEAADPPLIEAESIEKNIRTISMAASDFGFFNIIPDQDGTVRWVPLAIRYGGEIYPHLSVEAVRKYAGAPPPTLNVAEYGVDSVRIGDIKVPTDEMGRLLINYRGPQKTFPHYSAADILSGDVPANAVRDKIVLMGATAIGIYDMRVVPFPGAFPGVEIHANVIDTILRRDFINRPEWLLLFEVLAIMFLGMLLSIIIPKIRAFYSILFTIFLTALYIIFNDHVFNSWRIWLSEIYPVFTIVFVSACVTTYQFMTEERKKKEIKEAFSHYVAPSLVHQILKDPKKLALGGEERRLTVLFSDIRGFTSISEGLQPQVLVKLMNDYLTPMTEIVLKNGGTIDKYMGDAVMAFWGAPIWEEDHALRSCRAAMEMLKRLEGLQAEWEKAEIPRLDIGIGISTGRVVVGNMGSSTRFDYTVMGDVVNLGSRLEGLNKEYNTRIIVPKYTYEDVKEEFIFRHLDIIKVKGKDIPIRIYELLGSKGDDNSLREMAELFDEGLKSYKEKDWFSAEEHFRAVLSIRPDDGPSKVFLSRIKMLSAMDLPKEWDGVFVMSTK